MGLIVIDKEYTDEQSRVYTNYFANVIDERKHSITLELNYNVLIGGSVVVEKDENHLFLPIGQTWESYGIVEGCTITGTYGGNTIPALTTVTFCEDRTLVLSSVLPGANANYSTGELFFDITPESIEFFFNYVPSSEVGNEFSLIDGNPNKYVADGVDALTIGGPILVMSQLGNTSGGWNNTPYIFRIADSSVGRKRYVVEFSDRQPYFLNGELFEYGDCVKPWYKFSFLSQTSNPSIRISTISYASLGNTGFFGESFNGNQPNYYASGVIDGVYEVASTTLTVSTDVVSVVDYVEDTDFIVRVDGKFDATSKFGIAFFRVPNPDEYQNLTSQISFNASTCIEDNLIVGVNPDIIGLLNSSGASVNITNVLIQQFGTYALIKGTIEPQPLFTSYISDVANYSKLYRLAVKVEDWELTGDSIKPVWLTASYGELQKYIPPLGAWLDAFGYTLTDHKGDTTPFVSGTYGFVPEYLITEDNVNLQLKLRVPRPSTQIAQGRTYTGVTVSVVAKHVVFGTTFKFESFDLPFGAELGDDTLLFDNTIGRGFKYPATSPNNVITTGRSLPEDNVDSFGVFIDYGILMNWKYWEQQLNAAIDFYPNQDKDWFHYQSGFWVLDMMFELQTTDGAYVNFVSLEHTTYDDSDVVSTIEFFKEDLTPITKPLLGEKCIVRATHAAPFGDPWESDVWGEITVEPFENSPRWLSSSLYDDNIGGGNPLLSMPLNTKLKRTLSGDLAIFETVFDASLINTLNGISFTSRVQGTSRKGLDAQKYWNRTKVSTELVKPPQTFASDDRSLNDCCEKRKVVGDTTDTDSYKNDVTSHVISGESVTFNLFDHNGDTGFVIASQPFAQQANIFYCTLNWRNILSLYGAGCYQLRATVNYAGLNEVVVIESFDLIHYSAEACANDVRIMSIFNNEDVRNGIKYNGTNVLDSIRVNGQFGYSQDNLNIRNFTKTDFEQTAITRQARETYEIRTSQLTDKFIKILSYHLQHESFCLISDYCFDNPRYDLKDKGVIVVETPTKVYSETGSRTISLTCKFEEKIIDNISTYSNDNPQASPIEVVFQNSGFATVQNTDESFIVTFDASTPYVIPDSTYNIFVDGVLDSSGTFISLEPVTNFNITAI